MKESEEYKEFKESELRIKLVEYAENEAKRMSRYTPMDKRAKLAALQVDCGRSINLSTLTAHMSHSRYWELQPTNIKRWSDFIDETRKVFSDLLEIEWLYHYTWSCLNIAEQLDGFKIDKRRSRTLLKDMQKKGFDPYSTTDKTVTAYLSALKNKKIKRAAKLEGKTN